MIHLLDASQVDLDGLKLIEASAGTGKTYTITTLYLRLLLEKELKLDQILVVTFTRAATAELRERIRERLYQARAILRERMNRDAPVAGGQSARLGEAPSPGLVHQSDSAISDPNIADPAIADPALKAIFDRVRGTDRSEVEMLEQIELAIEKIDEAAIFTIHGFCQRVLQDFAFECQMPFEIEMLDDESHLFRRVVEDLWAANTYEASPMLVARLLDRKIDSQTLKTLAELAIRHDELQLIPRSGPEMPEIGREKEREREWRESMAQAGQIWREEGPAIIEMLCLKGRLNGNSYRVATIRNKWSPLLDEVFDRIDEEAIEPGLLTPLEFAEKLCPPMLADKTNAKFKESPPQHAFFEAFERAYEADRSLLLHLDLEIDHLLISLVDQARSNLAEAKREAGQMAFSDQLLLLRKALKGEQGPTLAEKLRMKMPAALIDEFQDTDPVQWEIFEAIYRPADGSDAPFFLIGDPKQAIYGFRGADVRTYLKVASSLEERWTLASNWRSDPGLIEVQNLLFDEERAGPVFGNSGIEYQRVQARPDAENRRLVGPSDDQQAAFEILYLPADADGEGSAQLSSQGWVSVGSATRSIARRVAVEIRDTLEAGLEIEDLEADTRRSVEAGDIAVLARNRFQIEAVQDALRQLGIPSVLISQSSVFDSSMADALIRVLRALAEPLSRSALRAAYSSRILGLNGHQLQVLETDEIEWSQARADILRWSGVWQRQGVLPALQTLMADANVGAGLLKRRDGERAMTDLGHLIEILHATETENRMGMRGLLRWLLGMRADEGRRGRMASESQSLRLESDEQAVKLVTVHSSKGLEYGIVYCPFLWNELALRKNDEKWPIGRSPDNSRCEITLFKEKDFSKQDASEDKDLAASIKKSALESLFEENLRLLYVALTRARHRCSVVLGPFNGLPTSPLAYLLYPLEGPGAGKGPQLDAEDSAPAAGDRTLRAKKIRELNKSDVSEGKGKASSGSEGAGKPQDRPMQVLDPIELIESLEPKPLAQKQMQNETKLMLGPRSFAALNPDQIEFRCIKAADRRPWRSLQSDSSTSLKARVFPGRPRPSRRISSFSSLARSRSHAGLRTDSILPAERVSDIDAQELAPLNAGRDHDEAVRSNEDVFAGSTLFEVSPTVGPAGPELDSEVADSHRSATANDSREDAPPSLDDLVPLADFPAGADPGNFMHAVFENSDFQIPSDQAQSRSLKTRVHMYLDQFGFDKDRWAEDVVASFSDVLDTPLIARKDHPGGLKLRSVALAARLEEMAFIMPVARGDGRALSPHSLSGVFRKNLGPGCPDDYADHLAGLNFGALSGHLRGYIDLIFESGGRWYIVDYKSNRLGKTWADYAPAALSKTMVEHDYVLQYHLYCLALHRYLRSRLEDYDYEEHFGGVFYLFLRGMHPAFGLEEKPPGVFHDRPTLALIDSLSAWFEGPGEDIRSSSKRGQGRQGGQA